MALTVSTNGFAGPTGFSMTWRRAPDGSVKVTRYVEPAGKLRNVIVVATRPLDDWIHGPEGGAGVGEDPGCGVAVAAGAAVGVGDG